MSAPCMRAHRLITRIPHTRRYQITDTGLGQALLFTHAPMSTAVNSAHLAFRTPTSRARVCRASARYAGSGCNVATTAVMAMSVR
jgi:hypothetical protein